MIMILINVSRDLNIGFGDVANVESAAAEQDSGGLCLSVVLPALHPVYRHQLSRAGAIIKQWRVDYNENQSHSVLR